MTLVNILLTSTATIAASAPCPKMATPKQTVPSSAPAIYVLCQSGGRARRAIEKLKAAGVQGCVLVEGGTQAWIDAGLPVNRAQSRVLPLMRQVQIIVGFLSAIGGLLALTVNNLFAIIPLVVGSGLLLAGLTGFCGLALVLAKMPWNKTSNCNSPSCCTTESK